MAVDAVILAAGRGQRMLGYTAPFFKPMLEVNGITLLAYAVEYAAAAGAERTVVVASPHNKEQVANVVKPYASWVQVVTQEEPRGPGHAVLTGVSAIDDSRKVMLLMSDNIMKQEKVVELAITAQTLNADAVGVRTVLAEQASRFTRIRAKWADGVARQHAYEFAEGVALVDRDYTAGDNGRLSSLVWCGPVIADTKRVSTVLQREWSRAAGASEELKIGPYLTEILRYPTYLLDVDAMDVGVPAAFEAAIEEASR